MIHIESPSLWVCSEGLFVVIGGGAVSQEWDNVVPNPHVSMASGKAKKSSREKTSQDAPGNLDTSKKDRKTNSNKNESRFWKKLKSVNNSKLKTSGKGKNRKIYDWDYTHNDIEVYNQNGKHLGSVDPETGQLYKPPVPGRFIKIN